MPISLETATETVEAIRSAVRDGFKLRNGHPSALTEAARRLGIPNSTIYKRWTAAERLYGLRVGAGSPSRDDDNGIKMPDFPEEEDIDIERIIELQKERFEKRKKSFSAHTWFPIDVLADKAIGIMWFGDPHVDDNGCNWTELEKDVQLCRETDGLYGANVGDTTNNWAGRLVRLYAEQDTSVGTARRLAEWFMLDSGVRWLVYILGNHDAWGDGSAVLMQMAKRSPFMRQTSGQQKLVLHDWEARFKLRFPCGWEPLIYTAHNFKGTSIWNPMHGLMREGQLGDYADLYVCGDLHTSGMFAFENAGRGHNVQTFIRVRGYKFLDDYARHHGYKEQTQGCSAVTIFDPKTRAITGFLNSEEGVEFLRLKRG